MDLTNVLKNAQLEDYTIASRVKDRRAAERQGDRHSPIQKLPAEILGHIFKLAHNESQILSYDPHAFPRVVAQVSSFWRSVAHSCAPLWTNITCEIYPPLEKYNPKHGKMLQECLILSKEMPLSLSFTGAVNPHDLGDDCVKALARSAYRWSNMTSHNGNLIKAIFSEIPKDTTLENLETLNLYIYDTSISISTAPKLKKFFFNSDARRGTHLTFTSAPSLIFISLEFIYCPSETLSGLDWSRITHFGANELYFQSNELIDILERMPNLVSLQLGGPAMATRPITTPCLETLYIDTKAEKIFDVLTAPRLKKLVVGWRFDTSYMGSIVGFVRRSNCVLEELKHGPTRIHESWCSPEFSSIKKLYFDALENTSSVSESCKLLTFENTPSQNDIFPGLEIMHIVCGCQRGSGWLDGDPKSTIIPIVNMLNSRLHAPGTDPTGRKYLKLIEFAFESSLLRKETSVVSKFVDSEIVKMSGVQVKIRDHVQRFPPFKEFYSQ